VQHATTLADRLTEVTSQIMRSQRRCCTLPLAGRAPCNTSGNVATGWVL